MGFEQARQEVWQGKRLASGFFEILREVRQKEPQQRAYLLVPSEGMRWEAQAALKDTKAVSILRMEEAALVWLSEAGITRGLLEEGGGSRLLGSLVSQVAQEGPFEAFGRVAEKAGFLRLLWRFLQEAKRQEIRPEAWEAYAQTTGQDRELEIARFYRAYEESLAFQGCDDREGLVRQITEAVRKDIQRRKDPNSSPSEGLGGVGEAGWTECLDGSWIGVVGFPSFSPNEQAFLATLGELPLRLRIAGVWDEAWSEDHPARAALEANVQACRKAWSSFEWRTIETSEESGQPARIEMIEASSREEEIREAMRRSKRLLREGAAPSQIAILAPQIEGYQTLLRSLGREMNLPLFAKKPWKEEAFALTLCEILSIAPEFRWRAVVSLLHLPWLKGFLSFEALAALDRLTREKAVVGGRRQWFRALDHACKASPATDPRDPSKEAFWKAIRSEVALLFDLLTPPEKAETSHHRAFVEDRILGRAGLDLEARLPDTDDGRRAKAVCAILKESLLDEEASTPNVERTWESFWKGCLARLSDRFLPLTLQDENGLWIGGLEIAMTRSFSTIFVVGLSEGEFPRPPDADPLFTEDERQSHPLPLERNQGSKDAILGWHLRHASPHLVLLRPRLDERGAFWPASPFWEEIQEEAARPVFRASGIVPRSPEDAASPAESLLVSALAPSPSAVFSSLTAEPLSPSPVSGTPTVSGISPVSETPLVSLQPTLAAIERGFAVHQARVKNDRAGRFDGVVEEDGLKATIADRWGETIRWSVSRLNRYGRCPYGFFSEHILGLEPPREPEEGMDVRQRGSLFHLGLEKIYRFMAQEGLRPCLAEKTRLLSAADRLLTEVFQSAPEIFGFQPDPMWELEQDEIRRMLARLLVWECQENEKKGFWPLFQEISFGLEEGDLGLFLGEAQGIRFALRGIIDRIDVDAQGHLRIVDYKSGSTPYTKRDLIGGRSMQSALYALVVRQALPLLEAKIQALPPEHGLRRAMAEAASEGGSLIVGESSYLHLHSLAQSGRLDFVTERRKAESEEVTQKTLETAARFVEQIRKGWFLNAPEGGSPSGCVPSCEWASLCRVTRHSLRKSVGEVNVESESSL